MTTAQSPVTVNEPNAWLSLWRIVTRFEREKIAPWIALRTALGITLPVTIAAGFGNAPAGIVGTTGALNVSFSDGSDPYLQRAARLLAATAVGSFAVFLGTLCGNYGTIAVFVATAWAVAAGMLVAIDTAAADIGLISLVTFVVFAAQPMAPEHAAYAGLLAASGGLLQTLLSLALWPLRRFEPERRVLGNLYLELSRMAAGTVDAMQSPPASLAISDAQRLFASRARDRSPQRGRYRSILNQAERMRLSILVLARSRARLAREAESRNEVALLDRCFHVTTRVLTAIANSLLDGTSLIVDPELLRDLDDLAEAFRNMLHKSSTPAVVGLLADVQHHIDAFSGQLRAAVDLAGYSTPAGRVAYEHRESARPWRLRLAGLLATLRANLTLRSPAFRHAIRLAACLTVGDAVARGLGLGRSYWVPMTIAIVLKPDFAATFSRGVLRLAGTFIGLVLATVLFHLLSPALPLEIGLIVLLGFILRCFGPANYGIFVIAISALVVVLFAVTGIAPREVVASRGVNTALGGALALGIYAIWPTWERRQLSETLARLLDAYRDYFRAVREGYLRPEELPENKLHRTRIAGRLARSNLEASVDRAGAEPGASAETLGLLNAILASSHRFAHAVMALEAGLFRSQPVPARPEFRAFANHVELTLHSLAATLRGSPLSPSDLPDLREHHHALIHAGDSLVERYALVNIETDRVTNSLNTLAGQILDYVGRAKGSGW